MNKPDLIATRAAERGDLHFIMSTMLRGLYYGETWFTLIPKDTFMKHYHDIITHILNKSDTTVSIACLKDDANVILGYAIHNSEVIHFIYVKKSWRGIGIAKDLAPIGLKTVTHLTKTGLSIIKKKNWTFNPFKI